VTKNVIGGAKDGGVVLDGLCGIGGGGVVTYCVIYHEVRISGLRSLVMVQKVLGRHFGQRIDV
jgi:hypothetical protein